MSQHTCASIPNVPCEFAGAGYRYRRTSGLFNLIEEFTKQREDSKTKFYRFLDVEFHGYKINTPTGK
jgi:hypothetical protein